MPLDPDGPMAVGMPALARMSGGGESAPGAAASALRQRRLLAKIQEQEMADLSAEREADAAEARARALKAQAEELRHQGEINELAEALKEQAKARRGGGGGDLTHQLLQIVLAERDKGMGAVQQALAVELAEMRREISAAVQRPDPPPPLESLRGTLDELSQLRSSFASFLPQSSPVGISAAQDLATSIESLKLQQNFSLQMRQLELTAEQNAWEREHAATQAAAAQALAERKLHSEMSLRQDMVGSLRKAVGPFSGFVRDSIDGTLGPDPRARGGGRGGGRRRASAPRTPSGPVAGAELDTITCVNTIAGVPCGQEMALPPVGEALACPACGASYGYPNGTDAAPPPAEAEGGAASNLVPIPQVIHGSQVGTGRRRPGVRR